MNKHDNHSNTGRRQEVPCIHTLSHRIGYYKRCIRNYECFHCLFDQWLDNTETMARHGYQPAGGEVGERLMAA